jgi:SAM-dependent methyltransferase
MLGMPAAWSRVAREYRQRIAPDFAPPARRLCLELGVSLTDRVLDVACGPGTAAREARALGARSVVGVDYATGMVQVAQAAADGDAGLRYVAANALALPFRPGWFDVVVSSFGLIFAPEPSAAVCEAARVLRPGGRLGLLVWPPEGSIWEYQQIAFRHLDLPATAHDPFQWGVPRQALTWLAPVFKQVVIVSIEVPFEAASPASAWEALSTATGRVAAAYAELDRAGRARLDTEMLRFFEPFQRADGRVYWPRRAMMVMASRT